MRLEDIRPDRQEEIGVLDPVPRNLALSEEKTVGLFYRGMGIDLEFGKPFDLPRPAERIDQPGKGAGGPSGQEEVRPPFAAGSGQRFRDEGERLLRDVGREPAGVLDAEGPVLRGDRGIAGE